MAQLKHDTDGFLQGERLEPTKLMQMWGGMQSDIQAIRRAIEKGDFRPSGLTGNRVATPRATPVPPAAHAASPAAPAEDAARAVETAMQQAVRPILRNQARDGGGRFKKQGDGAGAGGAGDSTTDADAGGRFNAVGSRVGSLVRGAGEAEAVDPAIKAFNEVAQPLTRGYEALFGGDKQEKSDKKHERWYRRIFGVIKKDGDEGSKDRKKTNRALKAIEGKSLGRAGAAAPGFMGNIMQGLGGGLGAGLLGPVARAGGAMMRGGGALMRRIPLLGGLLAAGEGLMGMWDSETSDMDRASKDKASGKSVGGAAGSIGGMLAGAKLGAALGTLAGPIGTAIGGVVGGAAGMFFGDKAGQVLGETVGGWVTSLREADIPGKFAAGIDYLKSGWDRTMEVLGAAWTAGTDYLKGAAKDVASWTGKKLDAANTAVRDATGIDVKAGASRAIDATKETAQKAGAAVKGAAQSAGQAIQQSTVGRGVTAVANAAKNAWQAGDRKKALVAEMDAQGITNKNERAMLLAQVDHESNGFRAGEESFNYRNADRIMAVSKTAAKKGKPAIEAAMKQGPEAVAELMYGGRMGNTEAGDGYKYRGRGSIQITGKDNYKKLGDKLGLDLVNNPDLLLDPEISAKASVQWWKDNGVGKAARAGDVTGATKIINGGTNGIEHRQELFAKYSSDPLATSAGIAAKSPVAVAAAPASAAVMAAAPAAPAMPGIPNPASAAPAPKVPTEIASAGGGRGSAGSYIADPGQDISDRRLAHIATGGVSTG